MTNVNQIMQELKQEREEEQRKAEQEKQAEQERQRAEKIGKLEKRLNEVGGGHFGKVERISIKRQLHELSKR